MVKNNRIVATFVRWYKIVLGRNGEISDTESMNLFVHFLCSFKNA